ncbi:MAG: hypothetical protein KAJ23_13890 [Maribacter sp.]|nr:hypothetical protein [Maribacter sp.]
MIEDELIKIWQSSPKVEQIKFEKSRLLIDMQSSLNRFHKLMKYGVLIEQVAAIIVIPVFIFYVYYVPHILSKIASILIALWAIWYMVKLRRLRNYKPNTITENYLDYLYQCRTYLRLLKKMGDTALYWYILPPMVGYMLFILGFSSGDTLENKQLIMPISVGIAVGVATYFYSRWIVKKMYAPRLKKIDELIKAMEE